MKIESDKNTPMHIPGDFTEKNHQKLGPLLSVLFIILILILGGLYLWGSMLTQEQTPGMRVIQNNEPETVRAVADAEIMSTVSSSDTLEAIEADVMSTNLDSLDAELEEMNRELETNIGS